MSRLSTMVKVALVELVLIQASIEKLAPAPKFIDELLGTEMPLVPSTLKARPTLPATNVGLFCSVPLFGPKLSLALFSTDHQLTSPAGTVAQDGIGSSSWIVSTAVAWNPSVALAPVTPDSCRLTVS